MNFSLKKKIKKQYFCKNDKWNFSFKGIAICCYSFWEVSFINILIFFFSQLLALQIKDFKLNEALNFNKTKTLKSLNLFMFSWQ